MPHMSVQVSLSANRFPGRKRSEEIHGQLWAIVEEKVNQGAESAIMALYVDSINEVIDVHSLRLAAVDLRLPSQFGRMLYAATLLSFLLVGVASSADGKRDTFAAMSPEERGWVHYTVEKLEEDEIAFLEGLPKEMVLEIDKITYGMTHLYQAYDEIVSLHTFKEFCERTFETSKIENLILGHTHRQAIRYLSDWEKWINPGSVSYRRSDDPDQTAHYATITYGIIRLHRLDYDRAPVYQAMQPIVLKESEMRVAERFNSGLKIN